MNPSKISLDELPQYIDWPSKLLCIEPAPVRLKTENEVMREFDREKWARLLDFAKREENLTLAKVEAHYCPLNESIVTYDEGEFWRTTQGNMLRRQIELYAEVLAPYAPGASALVELGAGYGSKIFELARLPAFSGLPLVAAEFSANGRELLRLLANSLKLDAAVGDCDFRRLKLDPDLVPENALIFTSLSAHYVPQLQLEFTEFLAKLKPRAVVHFEPIFEHFSLNTIHDLMCRRYIELNDYTRNLQTVINHGVSAGRIEILEERKKVQGNNPFLPISVLAWAPLPSGS